MDAIFKFMVHEESKMWTSQSLVLAREAYYSSQVSRICVASMKVEIGEMSNIAHSVSTLLRHRWLSMNMHYRQRPHPPEG